MKNILFDLGNVIVKLDTESVKKDFQKYTNLSFTEFYQKNCQIFDQFETGHISEEEFISKIANLGFPKDKIVSTWNSLIVGIPEKRIQFLKSIQSKYNLYFYSNTNSLHINYLDTLLQRDNHISLKEFENIFVDTWYSHDIGFRKPHRSGFDFIVQTSGIKPSDTLFIDDTISSLDGAIAVGINSVLHHTDDEIQDVFDQYLKSFKK